MTDMHGTRWLVLILAASVLLCFSYAEADGGEYKENDMNYVEESMDISGGIPENATGVLARIRENGVLRIATDGDWPPQEFIDPDLEGQDRIVGADMQLARLIAKRMGVKLEIVVMDFDDVLPSLDEGKCDLAISALAFSPSRAASYTMSKGYYFADAPMTVMVIRAEDAENIASPEDLKWKTIIAQRGSLQESIVASEVKKYKEFRRVAVDENDAGIYHLYDMIKDGSADALAMDAGNASAYLEVHPESGLMIAEGEDMQFILSEAYRGDRIAARKGEYMLMYFVNGVIDEVLDITVSPEIKNREEKQADDQQLIKGLYSQWIEEAEVRWEELEKQNRTNNEPGE